MYETTFNLVDQSHLIHQLAMRLSGLDAALETLLLLLHESGAGSVPIDGLARLIHPLGQEAKAANALLALVIPEIQA